MFQVFLYFLSRFQFCFKNTNSSVWFPRKRCKIREDPRFELNQIKDTAVRFLVYFSLFSNVFSASRHALRNKRLLLLLFVELFSDFPAGVYQCYRDGAELLLVSTSLAHRTTRSSGKIFVLLLAEAMQRLPPQTMIPLQKISPLNPRFELESSPHHLSLCTFMRIWVYFFSLFFSSSSSSSFFCVCFWTLKVLRFSWRGRCRKLN